MEQGFFDPPGGAPPGRAEVVAALRAAGLGPEIAAGRPEPRPGFVVQGPDASNARFSVYETKISYRYTPGQPYMPRDIAAAMQAAIARVLPELRAPRVALHLVFVEDLPAGAGGRRSGVAARSRPRVARPADAPAALLGEATLAYIVDALEREDRYDRAEELDFVPDWSEGDAGVPNRLGGVTLVLRELRVPGGGAGLAGVGPRTAVSFDVPDALCGQACLAFHRLGAARQKDMVRRPAMALRLAREVADALGAPGRMAVTDFERFRRLEGGANARVVIFDGGRRVIFDSGVPGPFPQNVYLLLDAEHYAYLRLEHVEGFAKNGSRAAARWCHDCLALVPARSFRTHCCAAGRCPHCGAEFEGDAAKAAHMAPAAGAAGACGACLKRLPFAGCAAAHVCEYFTCPACRASCRLKDRAAHACGFRVCPGCAERVPAGGGHRCFIRAKALPRPSRKAHPYFAYDIEATIDGEGRHAIALMVVKELYSGAEGFAVLRGAGAATAWLDAMKDRGPATLIAHNAAEYDAPLLYQALCERPGAKPRDLVMAGEKILFMAYGPLRFIDSRRHVAGSLAALARTFRLAEGEKGFFPYAFFTPENRAYVGPVPDRAFFPQAGREGFDAWHASFEGRPYDIAAECERYCRQDVHILASALEVYQREALELNGVDPLRHVTIASYAQAVYRTLFMPPASIPQLSRAEYDFVRPALLGGRTEAFALLREWSPADVEAGRFGRYVDVNSMYPAVQRDDPLPGAVRGFGAGPLAGGAAEAFVAAHAGGGAAPALAVVVYDADPPPDLFHPVLLRRDGEGRLLGTLEPLRRETATSVELARALEAGYTGLVVHAWLAFDARRDLFAGYVARFHALKGLHAPAGPEPNPGKSQIAKLMLNSLWGKFAQRDPEKEYYIAQDEASWYRDVARYHAGGEALEVVRDGGSYLLVARTLAAGERLHLGTTNVALAAFVTAHARLRLHSVLALHGPKALYCDTDSVVYEAGPGDPQPTGPGLGEWKDETGGDPIVRFVALAPKTWGFETASGASVVKCKGFPASWASVPLYVRLLRGEQDAEVNETTVFTRSCKGALGVRTFTARKKLSFLFHKRAVHGFSTLPFGWRGPPPAPAPTEPSPAPAEPEPTEPTLTEELNAFLLELLDG